jgi:hypothetical protein
MSNDIVTVVVTENPLIVAPTNFIPISPNPVSSSYALTASYALNGGGSSGTGSGGPADWNTLLNKPGGLVSSSTQVNTGSFDGSASYAPVAWNDVHNVPVGLISASGQLPQGLYSSSAQVNYGGLSGIPSGLLSSSAQLPTGIVSSSGQLPTGTVSSSAQVIGDLPTGLISSSGQLPSGIVSSSAQLPTGVVSSSAQLPSGVVSSSAQFTTGSYTGSFTGTLQGNASTATTASAATSLTFQVATASFALSAGSSGGGLTGAGTSGKVAVWSGGALSSSILDDNGSRITTPFPVTASAFKGDGTAITNVVSASYAPVGWIDVHNVPSGLVSASSQITFTAVSSIPAGLVSSSGQINYAGLTNIPAAIVSSSGQVTFAGLTGIPGGLVSSSAQVNTGSFTGSFIGTLTGNATTATSASYAPSNASNPDWSTVTNKPAGLVSSSGQVTYAGLSNIPAAIVSSSGQVTFSGLSSIPVGLYSSSAQLPSGVVSSSAQLPSGIVSSSAQYGTGSYTGSFTGSHKGDGSALTGIVSSSFAISSSAATSITFVPVLSTSSSYALSASYAPGGSAVNFSTGSYTGSFTGDGSHLTGVGSAIPGTCNGRLTLLSGTPIPTADVTGSTNVYFTPYNGSTVCLYNGSGWQAFSFTETTLALGTVTSGANYDVFLYNNSGTLTLESVIWTNDTTRATALATQDGVYCKSGTLTHLYLGTFRTTSTTTTEDSEAQGFLFNAFNQRPRFTRGSGVYGSDVTTTNGGLVLLSSNLDLSVLVGLAQNVSITQQGSFNNTAGSIADAGIGVQVDSGTIYTTRRFGADGPTGAQVNTTGVANIGMAPGLHVLHYMWGYNAGAILSYQGASRGSVSNIYSTCITAMVLR